MANRAKKANNKNHRNQFKANKAKVVKRKEEK